MDCAIVPAGYGAPVTAARRWQQRVQQRDRWDAGFDAPMPSYSRFCAGADGGRSRQVRRRAGARAVPARASTDHNEGAEMSYVWMAVVGFAVGLIARAVLPGTQSLGIVLTAVLGIAGSFAAGFVGQALGLYSAGQGAGFIGSVIGAIVLLFVWSKVKGGQGSA